MRYLEAHGTGTRLGDPIEVGSAASVIAQFRQDSAGSSSVTVVCGTLKANVGHLETVAAGAGVFQAREVLRLILDYSNSGAACLAERRQIRVQTPEGDRLYFLPVLHYYPKKRCLQT